MSHPTRRAPVPRATYRGVLMPEPADEGRQFSNPEAITYYEYVSDCIVAAKL